jgi:hypothetical protein
MRVLLDTQVLLWALAEPTMIDEQTRAAIEAGDNEVLFSAASIWEVAIKAGLGRPDFAFDPRHRPSRTGYRVYRIGGPRERGCSRQPAAAVASRSFRSAPRDAGDRQTGDPLHGRSTARALFGLGQAYRREFNRHQLLGHAQSNLTTG